MPADSVAVTPEGIQRNLIERLDVAQKEKVSANFSPEGPFALTDIIWLPAWTQDDKFEITGTLPPKRGRQGLTPRASDPPRNVIIEVLKLQELLDNQVVNQSQLADQMNLTRARVCQILALLRLPQDVVEDIRSLTDAHAIRFFTERRLRDIIKLKEPDRQRKAYQTLKDMLVRQR
jgi:hypothetical protein